MDFKDAPQIITHVRQSLDFTPFCARWIPSSARVVVTGQHAKGTGAIEVFSLQKGSLKRTAKIEAKDCIRCASFGASFYENRTLATGCYDGRLRLYDVERLAETFSVDAHGKFKIYALDAVGGLNVGGGAPEIVTGGGGGCVHVWDPRTSDPVASLVPAEGEERRECWAVGFGGSFDDDNRSVVAGFDNGDVKMLDLRMNKLVWEANVSNGVVGVQFDRKDIKLNKLVLTCLESRLRVYDMATYHPKLGYASMTTKAHNSTVWFGEHLPQCRDVFMSGGGNGQVALWKYSYPTERKKKDMEGGTHGVMGKLTQLNDRVLSDQPVTSWDWNRDKLGLGVCTSFDQAVRVVLVSKLNTHI